MGGSGARHLQRRMRPPNLIHWPLGGVSGMVHAWRIQWGRAKTEVRTMMM